MDINKAGGDLEVARKTIELGAKLDSWPTLLETPVTAYVVKWRASERRRIAAEQKAATMAVMIVNAASMAEE